MILRSCIENFIKTHSFKGRQKSFTFNDEGLQQYINWAFCNDLIVLCSNEKEITGIGIVYPISKIPSKILDLLPADNIDFKENICIMDLIANDKNTRQQLTKEFMKKHPNWRSLNKWAIRNGSVVELNNKYIELVGGTI